jgi:hypothetical protein
MAKKQEEYEEFEFPQRGIGKYPAVFQSIAKRLRTGIDPWNTFEDFNAWETALMLYFRIKQSGINSVKLSSSPIMAWCEIDYNGEIWILNTFALMHSSYGRVVFPKVESQEKFYTTLHRIFDSGESFYASYESKMSYTLDEYIIKAQEDKTLSSAFSIKFKTQNK